jgi:hypothetical protein
MSRVATLVAVLAALAAGGAGLKFSTRAVGGSDSSCYGLMVRSLSSGRLQPQSTLAASAPWPNAALTLAPAGFIPSPLTSGAASPVCAPGFALLATPLVWMAGPDAFFWLSPLAGAVLVWLAFMLARSLADSAAGAAAAVTTATMPVLLYQLVQPMNDVTTAACWVGGIVAVVVPARPRPWLAGFLIGLSLLVRPNLLPAAVVLGLLTVWRHGILVAVRLAAAVVPAGLVVLACNAALYGGVLASGYGSAAAFFSSANIPLNLSRYGRSLLETQFGWPLLGTLAPLAVAGPRRSSTWLVLISALTVITCYLPYTSYPEWWYLRFLLPAVVPLAALAAAACAVILRRFDSRGDAVLLVAAVLIAVLQVRVATERQAFELRTLEARFRVAGETIRDRLPAGATAITVWDSGSIRYHAGNEVVLWDSLDPSWLDRAAAWLENDGRTPVVVVERWEESRFRERFAGQQFGGLDWPPRFDVDNRVRVFVMADRARYLAGEPAATEIVWAR